MDTAQVDADTVAGAVAADKKETIMRSKSGFLKWNLKMLRYLIVCFYLLFLDGLNHKSEGR